MVSRPLRPDADPADIAVSLREQHGPHSAWLLATHEMDEAAASGDKKTMILWRRVVRLLDDFER